MGCTLLVTTATAPQFCCCQSSTPPRLSHNSIHVARIGALYCRVRLALRSQVYGGFSSLAVLLRVQENSNKHHYLAVSGFELYGFLYAADGTTVVQWGKVAPGTQEILLLLNQRFTVHYCCVLLCPGPVKMDTTVLASGKCLWLAIGSGCHNCLFGFTIVRLSVIPVCSRARFAFANSEFLLLLRLQILFRLSGNICSSRLIS